MSIRIRMVSKARDELATVIKDFPSVAYEAKHALDALDAWIELLSAHKSPSKQANENAYHAASAALTLTALAHFENAAVRNRVTSVNFRLQIGNGV